jgi:hypothetical protein
MSCQARSFVCAESRMLCTALHVCSLLLLLLLQRQLPPALAHQMLLPQVLGVALPQCCCFLHVVRIRC